jgi:hypothetical protein
VTESFGRILDLITELDNIMAILSDYAKTLYREDADVQTVCSEPLCCLYRALSLSKRWTRTGTSKRLRDDIRILYDSGIHVSNEGQQAQECVHGCVPRGGVAWLTCFLTGGLRVMGRVLWEPFESQFGDFATSLKRNLAIVELEATRVDRHGMRSFWLSSLKKFDVLLADLKQREMAAKGEFSTSKCTRCDRLEVLTVETEERRLSILDWIPSVDYKPDNDAAAQLRHEGTGAWVLRDETFTEWLNSAGSSLLWCRGKRKLTFLAYIATQHVD